MDVENNFSLVQKWLLFTPLHSQMIPGWLVLPSHLVAIMPGFAAVEYPGVLVSSDAVRLVGLTVQQLGDFCTPPSPIKHCCLFWNVV